MGVIEKLRGNFGKKQTTIQEKATTESPLTNTPKGRLVLSEEEEQKIDKLWSEEARAALATHEDKHLELQGIYESMMVDSTKMEKDAVTERIADFNKTYSLHASPEDIKEVMGKKMREAGLDRILTKTQELRQGSASAAPSTSSQSKSSEKGQQR